MEKKIDMHIDNRNNIAACSSLLGNGIATSNLRHAPTDIIVKIPTNVANILKSAGEYKRVKIGIAANRINWDVAAPVNNAAIPLEVPSLKSLPFNLVSKLLNRIT